MTRHGAPLAVAQALRVGDPGTLRNSIPRADLAAGMLDALGDDATIGAFLGVSSR